MLMVLGKNVYMHNACKIKWKNSGWFVLAAVVIILDQLSKLWAIKHLAWAEPMQVFPVLNFHLAYNTGAAYSFLHHASGWQNIFFIGLAGFVSAWLVYSILTDQRIKACVLHAGFALILGGALSNAWDRIQYKAVIDFINPHIGNWYFAIFNVADSAITLGAICLLWFWWREK